MQNKQKTNLIMAALILGCLVLALVLYNFSKNQGLTDQNTNNQNEANSDNQISESEDDQLANLFDLENKDPQTKLYVSDKLGVGFTYYAPETLFGQNNEVEITENDNVINVNGHRIEVLEKDANLSLTETLESTLLKGFDSEKCFITEEIENLGEVNQNYQFAKIDFPFDPNAENPLEAVENCPEIYSSNGKDYFIYNPEVPSKYVFVNAGFDAVALDGYPVVQNANNSWDSSIQILK